ncbi:MOSC N-terminal beta barrel domain-containing protein [Mrakia frigida]|uniref:MOSC domain-containing protein n=1 Tax=Mrakia frigida TaxID=29902 RepID=UPI003FCC1D2B
MSISDPSSWAALPLPLFLLLPFSFFFFFPRKTAQPSSLDAGHEKEKLASTPSLSEKTSQISTTRNEGMRIKELWIYPVKSCKGLRVEESAVEIEGLEFDRRWMIVEEATLKACTGRQFPKMVLIECTIVGSNLRVSIPESIEHEGDRSFEVPAKPSEELMKREGWESHDNLNLWSIHLSGSSPPSTHPSSIVLSEFFKRPVRMVFKSGEQRARSKKGPDGCFTAFADTYPLHVLTLQTLKELALSLSTYVENPLPFDVEGAIQRFRPNVVVETPEGTEAFEEDCWGGVGVGAGADGVESEGWGLEVVGRCGRCTMPNVSSAGTRHPTLPYRLLNATRPKEVDEFVGVPCPVLGVYAVPIFPPSSTQTTEERMVWKVGDAMRVRSRVDRSQKLDKIG